MSDRVRLKIAIQGAVQGVGFRPFVFRLAEELALKGWVNNSAQGVFIEVEGPRAQLEAFRLRLETEKPPRSFIQSLEASWLDPVGYTQFQIRESDTAGAKVALVLPDIATCPDCWREIFDPENRRYFYPFTNCTNCGPRFSIIESLPYDRANTSMKQFQMCPACQAEYDDPRDRRFHAQPNACPVCGPHLELWDREGRSVELPSVSGGRSMGCLTATAEALRAGKIVAVKGLGGFHLMVAAHDDGAVRRLRELKHREEKPFALMFPSMDSVKAVCEVSPLEERLLRSPESPIVLLRRFHASRITHHAPPLSPSLAPGNPNLGVLLPYTPLHHLLLSLVGAPVVATSGNLSDEPICIDENEALERLGGIADLFLVHNRPIVRHVDDSIVRVMAGRELVLRRARGYAPLPVQVRNAECGVRNVLAVGAHLKNTVALAVGPQVFVSQHIGDLETDQAYEAFRRVIADFEKLYEAAPALVAADAHPDYLSTKFARELSDGSSGRQSAPLSFSQNLLTSAPAPPSSDVQVSRGACDGTPLSPSEGERENPRPHSGKTCTSGPRLLSVQHHLAHVLSCMAENELSPPVLGVSWDGTGYGLDGTVWGGEFFLVTETAWERVAHFRPFRLPGGDKAVKQPRRIALGLLYELFGEAAFAMKDLAPVSAFSSMELTSLKTMLERRLNSPLTSSAGRLFDAVAALAGLRQQVRFEGQAAMDLEFAAEAFPATSAAYDIALVTPPPGPLSRITHHPSSVAEPLRRMDASLLLDWSPLVNSLLADVRQQVPLGEIAARFHNGLVEAIVQVARRLAVERVALSGGCFQNRYLTERAVRRLQEEGLRPYWHQRVPPNDGGIALGQVLAARRELAE